MKIRKFFVINENACTKYKNLGDAKKVLGQRYFTMYAC